MKKNTFGRRLLYSFTNDYKYINEMVSKSEGEMVFLSKLESVKDKNIFIYGAGIKGSRLIRLFPNINWRGYVDVAKKGKSYCGLNIYGLEKVIELKNKSFWLYLSKCIYKGDVDFTRSMFRKYYYFKGL